MSWQETQCRSCKAFVRFIRSTKSGKNIIVNADPVTSDGTNPRLALVLETGVVMRNPPKGTTGWITHFATCPNANEWKRKSPTITHRKD